MTKSSKILDRLEERKLLLADGAWGTMLQEKGLQVGECPELWNLTHRSDVLEIATEYIIAGSDIIETNSFGGNPSRLANYGLEDKITQVNEEAARISREAAGDEKLVMGSVGPTGKFLMTGDISEEEMYEGFREQIKALVNGGVDAICIETMSAIDEARIAINAARDISNLEIACTFTFSQTVKREFKTMMGHSPEEVVQSITETGADIIGTNCGQNIDEAIAVTREIRKIEPECPILVQPNAGIPIEKNGIYVYDATPVIMASRVKDLIEAGANIIGGCCGTTPEHIKAIAQVLKTCQ